MLSLHRSVYLHIPIISKLDEREREEKTRNIHGQKGYKVKCDLFRSGQGLHTCTCLTVKSIIQNQRVSRRRKRSGMWRSQEERRVKEMR